ncbi:MAG: efflux transporter outer membrane subunit [Myxococcota bacterium]|nr:efflux transporter outer membrane subunit [Myxococcota bacterium]
MKFLRFVACVTLAFHVSCAIGPNYKRPVVEVPEVYRGSLDSREAKSLADLAWWEIFQDPVLVDLIETALNNNLDLQMAVARTEQAYRLSIATNSAFYPQVGYQGSAGKARSQDFRSAGEGIDYTTYMGAFNVAWEIDIWGRIRRASESAKAQLLASEEFQRGVLLSVVSEVAALYFILLELDRAKAISVQAVEAFQETLVLFTRKYEGGVASRLEVTRAAAAEAQAAAWLPEIEIDIAKVENMLSVLLGQPPGAIPRGTALINQALPTLPAGLPSALLERRPDIREAEEQVISANAEVGVAMGNFLPRIGLVSMWGGSSQDLSGMISGTTSIWNVAAELSGPLFQGGLLYAQYKSQQAFWEESKARYELTALNAFAEVSTAITDRRLRKNQRAAREREVQQLSESVNLSLIRYRQGLANYFEVLQAQQELFPAEFDLSEARLEERLAVIRLYRALGGGWQLGLNWIPEAAEPVEEPASSSDGGTADENPPAQDSKPDPAPADPSSS